MPTVPVQVMQTQFQGGRGGGGQGGSPLAGAHHLSDAHWQRSLRREGLCAASHCQCQNLPFAFYHHLLSQKHSTLVFKLTKVVLARLLPTLCWSGSGACSVLSRRREPSCMCSATSAVFFAHCYVQDSDSRSRNAARCQAWVAENLCQNYSVLSDHYATNFGIEPSLSEQWLGRNEFINKYVCMTNYDDAIN